MPTLETTSDLDLPRIDDWFAGDSRRITFRVEQDGEPRNIEDDEIAWALYEKPYGFDDADAVIDDDTAGVSIVREPQFDPETGEFQVRVDGETLAGEWGEFWQRVTVDAQGASRQSWRGAVWIESE